MSEDVVESKKKEPVADTNRIMGIDLSRRFVGALLQDLELSE
jgi:hypothetical protein